MKQLSVVYTKLCSRISRKKTSDLMRKHCLDSKVMPCDVFLAFGIKVEDLVDHPAVVYQWLRYVAGYRKGGNFEYTTEQIKEKLKGATEDQICKFVDEARKQNNPVLVEMVQEVWGNKRPATVTETAVAT